MSASSFDSRTKSPVAASNWLARSVVMISLSQCAAGGDAGLVAAVQDATAAGAQTARTIRACCTIGYAEASTRARLQELDRVCLPLADAYDELRAEQTAAIQALRQGDAGDPLVLDEHTAALRHAISLILRTAQPFHRGCP